MVELFKKFLTVVGAIIVFGFAFAFVKFDLGTRIEQVMKLDPQALPEYMKMFDIVLSTGDPAKGMVKRVKMRIPKGMSKAEAFKSAIEVMDEVASEHGLAMVDSKTMPREGKLFRNGGILTHIRSYCSPAIADRFLSFSPYFIGFMPCRIGIVEELNGDIYLYTMGLELMINGGQTLPKEMLELANEVREGMYAMLEAGANFDEY
ncbi:MAG: DUF302 domain-containing protein [Sulfurovum sp.]|nr:DUF302 domain-containing protein [Sulfurovum sp.]